MDVYKLTLLHHFRLQNNSVNTINVYFVNDL